MGIRHPPLEHIEPECCGYNNMELGERFQESNWAETHLLLSAPPWSQSHGRHPSMSLLRPQCSGCRRKHHQHCNLLQTQIHLTQRHIFKHSPQASPDCPTTHEYCSPGCRSTPTSSNTPSLPALLPPCCQGQKSHTWGSGYLCRVQPLQGCYSATCLLDRQTDRQTCLVFPCSSVLDKTFSVFVQTHPVI